MTITRDEIRRVLGPVDDTLAADIVNTGASEQELAEAWAWVNSDEALINDGRPLPGGRVAELVALLVADEEEEEDR
ncbi:MAG: hypothetical protein KJ947_23140 [Alphaproteobacteria bacterium]|nr:hypothetical protein [Alphaproteobacteria bacterium]MBU1552444.1 hypothetical protein [Alphaproteobacteria bacterium]MBU2339525.1 hypothetical protein [Alphaproteobacteria bacterium]MBU2390237.1 hypothetical protein [Alphaproteobacteria bacterium]